MKMQIEENNMIIKRSFEFFKPSKPVVKGIKTNKRVIINDKKTFAKKLPVIIRLISSTSFEYSFSLSSVSSLSFSAFLMSIKENRLHNIDANTDNKTVCSIVLLKIAIRSEVKKMEN